MVWWKDRGNPDRLPEELRGKSPEELAVIIASGQTLADELKAAKEAQQASEDKLKTQDTEFAALKQKLADIEAKVTPQPVIEDQQEDPPSVWSDPEGFVRDQTKDTNNVALAAGIMASKMYFMQGLQPRDSKIFKKYEKDVETIFATFPQQQRVMPQSWMNAFLYIKGLHEGDISKAERENTDFFSEVPSRGGHDDPPPEAKLSPEEEETCRVMRWDPKAYLERKKGATIMSTGKGSYAKFAVPTQPNK